MNTARQREKVENKKKSEKEVQRKKKLEKYSKLTIQICEFIRHCHEIIKRSAAAETEWEVISLRELFSPENPSDFNSHSLVDLSVKSSEVNKRVDKIPAIINSKVRKEKLSKCGRECFNFNASRGAMAATLQPTRRWQMKARHPAMIWVSICLTKMTTSSCRIVIDSVTCCSVILLSMMMEKGKRKNDDCCERCSMSRKPLKIFKADDLTDKKGFWSVHHCW